MNRSTKIITTIIIIAAMTFAFAIIISNILKPNQNTPIKDILPDTSSSKIVGNGTVAAWIWHYPTELNDKAANMVDFASKEGINTFYLYIDEYIDIYEIPNKDEKLKKMADYTKAVKNILTLAKAKNIKVHALSGNTSYSYDSNNYIPPIIVKGVFDFNKENPDTPFDGIQFDVEFYDDKRFFGSTEEYTKSYLDLISSTAKQVNDLNKQYHQNLRLGFVIPFWFDKANDYFSSPILPTVIKNISKASNSYIVVMAYRNKVEEAGGVMEVSKDELEMTQKTSVKVVIGQELVQNKDTKITYFGESRNDIKQSFSKIIDLGKTYSSFEGISIHTLDAFMDTL